MEFTRKTIFDPIRKIWKGPKESQIYDRDASFGQIVYSRMLTSPNNVIQINDSEKTRFTNSEVIQMSSRIALSLMKKGLKQSDFVGIMAGNTSYVLPLVFGCYFAGIPFNPLDTSSNGDLIAHCWGKTKPQVIFCDGNVYGLIEKTVEKLRLNCTIYTLNNHLDNVPNIDVFLLDKGIDEKLFVPVHISSGNQTAYVLCSSGSTGLSKLVCVSHRKIRLDDVLTCEDVFLSFSTICWGTGLRDIHNSGLTGCTRLVISETFSPSKAMDLIERYNVTATFLVPRNIALMLNCPEIETRNLKSLNCVATGGSKLPVDLRTRFQKLIDPNCQFRVFYGISEMGVISSTVMEGDSDSSGTLHPNLELKLLDSNGKKLGIEEEGEIHIRCDVEWMGYYEDVDATVKVYQNGWYKTGDLGRFDNNGFIYISDRIVDVINCKGFHVSPSEIEALIVKLPEVQEVSVCGIPDVMSINLLAALVVKKERSEVSCKSIQDYVAEKMPHFKQLPGGVYFVDSLPRTASGKVMRRFVQELAEKFYKSS
ncbi:hypothetical protein ACFFRR_002985 [Megaselia abdita]